MANDIICEISSENELICEMSSAGEIVVEINGMTYQSVAAELAGKASVEDVALKADKTYVDNQDALKADLADLALKADKTYVDSQDATKADSADLALKADKTYVDSQDLLKADATALTALADLVPAATGLITVTSKNQYYPVAEDNTGAIVGRRLVNVWNGTSWVEANANGFGNAALSNNTGTNASGFGFYALRYNTGANANGFGHFALHSNTGANANGFGFYALHSNTGASANGFGHFALHSNTGAYANGFGHSALRYNTGAYNSAFGHLANNTTDATINALTNTTCLGANTLPNKSNQVVLGDGSVDTVKMGGTARTPASSTAPGVKGETCWDTNYFYICVATNIWKRIPMEVW